MKRKTGQIFDKHDEKIVHLFIELGMPKNLAKVLMYISQVDDCYSSEIEQASNMLQPQVSVAMQELRRRGWVKKHIVKKKKKGRPVHHYRLSYSLPEILKNFEKEKNLEIKNIEKNLSELKGIIEG